MYMLFCHFKDLIDIKTGSFEVMSEQFKPKEFFQNIAK